MAENLMQILGAQEDDLYNEVIRDALENRILIINEEINECVVENYIMHILYWNREDKNIPAESRRPIKLYINSPGGSSFDGWGLVSVIEQSVTPVYAVALGLVASMGYHIYLSCEKRFSFKDSIFLQHDGDTIIQNSSSKAKQTMKFFDDMEKRTKQFVLSHTKMTDEFYDSVYDQEYWFYGDDGKDLGVVHYIIGEDADINEIL